VNDSFEYALYDVFFDAAGPYVRGVDGNALALNHVAGVVVGDLGLCGFEVCRILTEPAPERPRPREEALVR